MGRGGLPARRGDHRRRAAALGGCRRRSATSWPQLRERLAWDFPFFAEHCLKIIPKKRSLGIIPFELNPEQLRLDAALRPSGWGEPQRAIVLKARQIGFSTYTQGKLIQHATQHANRDALVVAQNKDTAGKRCSDRAADVPAPAPDPDLGIKPPIAKPAQNEPCTSATRRGSTRTPGNIGINSSLTVDTAQEAEAGRGRPTPPSTPPRSRSGPTSRRSCSASSPRSRTTRETLVILESTANGNNFFRDLWDDAVDGTNGYIPFFAPWHEDPSQPPAVPHDGPRGLREAGRLRALRRGGADAAGAVRPDLGAAALAPVEDRPARHRRRPPQVPPGVPRLPGAGVHLDRLPRVRPAPGPDVRRPLLKVTDPRTADRRPEASSPR
jgi:hypothetical protein